MKKRFRNRATALVLTVCLAVPSALLWGGTEETKAAEEATTVSYAETGDTNESGSIDIVDLVRVKKNAESESVDAVFDLNNDSSIDNEDRTLMRQFLVGKISSFFRPDTSAVNNDTATYSVTDGLDREMTVADAETGEKKVGVHYYLNHATNATWGTSLLGSGDTLTEQMIDADVQMLTDAGVDFLAVDITEVETCPEQLTMLMAALDKYSKQGFKVPKVTFTSDASEDNQIAAINIDSIVTGKSMDFITSQAYSGGSKISFKAYAPKVTAAGWFSVCYTSVSDSTTDTNFSVYRFLESNGGHGKQYSVNNTNNGKWIDCEIQLPNDENDYYVYFGGAKGQWAGHPLLVDDVTITSVDESIVVTEDFSGDMSSWLFKSSTNVTQEDEKITTADELETACAGYDNLWEEPIHGVIKYVDMDSLRTVRAARKSISHERSYNNGKTVETENQYLMGYNFAWEFELAMEDDESIVLIDSWNDMTADSLAYSSDFQPMNSDGGSDNYYMQLVDAIKQFKGNKVTNANLNTAADADKLTIDVTGDFQQWNKVNGHYLDYSCDATANVNDIAKMKMTTDETNLYAYVETVDDITNLDGANRMSLFISTGNVGGCWEQYEYVINRGALGSDGKLTVEKQVGGAWTNVGSADYRLVGNKLQLAIPLSVFGFETFEAFDLEFKWADGYAEGDIESFYTTGDTAPYGRLNYVFTYEGLGNVASIDIDNMNANEGEGGMNFITKNAYPGGSTITFKAYVPVAQWWTVNWGTDASAFNIYQGMSNGTTNGSGNLYSATNKGKWATYTIQLPQDENSYYIAIGGAKGNWGGEKLLVDDFKITSTSHVVLAKDTFNHSLVDGIFNVIETKNDKTIVAIQNTTETVSDMYANIHAGYLHTGASPNFYTKNTYPKGSTVSFKIKLPSKCPSWWTIGYYTDITKGIYTGTSTTSDGTRGGLGTLTESYGGEWHEISMDLSKTADCYVIFGANQPSWGEEQILIDDFKITDSSGAVIAKDNFDSGFEKGIFKVTELTGTDTAVSLDVAETVEEIVDNVVAIKWTNHTNPAELYTTEFYPAGSTITFDAFVPNATNVGWMAACWATSQENKSIYGSRQDQVLSKGSWKEYTATIPAGTTDTYQFYFGANEGTSNWLDADGNPAPMLIDNVRIIGPTGEILVSDNFNYSDFSDGIFTVDSSSKSVSLVSKTDDAQKKNNGITFTAYSAPTINGEISADVASALDTAYEKLSLAGFNKALAMTEGNSEANAIAGDVDTKIKAHNELAEKIAGIVLDVAEKHNIQYYVKNWAFYNLARNFEYAVNESYVNEKVAMMFSADNEYIKHAAYGGNFGFDEPGTAEMDAIALQVQAYNNRMTTNGTTGEVFVNLLPNYANGNQLYYGEVPEEPTETKTYEEYVDKYFETIAPKLGYVCWDYYPLGVKNNVRTTYLSNLKLMAEKSKASTTPVELRTCIQASGSESNSLRTLTSAADLRFQIYTGMAFGVREFVYFSYTGGIYKPADQTYTDVYGYAAEVNHEVHGMEDVYDQYDWQGIAYKEVTAGSNSAFTAMDAVASSSTASKLTFASVTQDTIAGIFKAKDAGNTRQNAYMLVNYSNPLDAAKDVVQVKLNGATTARVYRGKQESIVSANASGNFVFTLNPGEGIFVVPEN